MKISKRQLRRIIKEEKTKLLKEQYGSEETGSYLIGFAQAYSSLGGAVQEQFNAVVNAYYQGGGPDALDDIIYEQNPSALRMAHDKLIRPLQDLEGEDAEDMKSLFEEITQRLQDMGEM